jgi:hypothetical protein
MVLNLEVGGYWLLRCDLSFYLMIVGNKSSIWTQLENCDKTSNYSKFNSKL